MQRTSKSIGEHLAGLEGSQGDDIRRLHGEIVDRLPGHQIYLYEGKFWGGSDQQIIGYGVVDYQNRSGEDVEWFLVGLAGQKNHISMYVNAVKDGTYLLRQYEKRLGKAKVGSASISFKSIEAVDFTTLMELVEEAGETNAV